MHYSTIAQRERSAYFDTFVGAATETLQHQRIAKKLGWMGLEQMNGLLQTAVLPNLRSGRIIMPRAQQSKDTIAILPLDEKNKDLTEAIFEDSGESERYIVEYNRFGRYSKRYDYTFRGKRDNPPLDRKAVLIWDEMWAVSHTFWDNPLDSHTEKRSKPWIIVNPELFKCQRAFIGAVAAHETIHCQDVIEDGPITLTYGHVASSELRAYHAASVILSNNGIDDPDGNFVEEARIRDKNNISSFVASPNLLKWMKRNELVI